MENQNNNFDNTQNTENTQADETTPITDNTQTEENTEASGVYYQNPPITQDNTQGQYNSYEAYPTNNPYVQPQVDNSKGLQIASLVLGIISIVGCCCCGFFIIPCGIVGLILGIIGMKRAKECGVNSGMSLAGIITSAVGIVIGLIVAAFVGLAYIADNSFVEDFYSEFGEGYYEEYYDYDDYYYGY